MSSSTEKNEKNKNRAHALAAWEWFKEAAWLQVLLIVAIVVGLVIAIPFVVQAIVNALNNDDSNFYENHRINYADYQRYTGGDNDCAGTVGNGQASYGVSDSEEGFVVMFYKQNDSDCTSMQSNIETWYTNFNKNYGSYSLKFYTIDCTWVVDDKDEAETDEGDYSQYENSFISLEEQQAVQDSVIDTYLSQNDIHKSSSVTEADLRSNLKSDKDSKTLPTPLFITYTRSKGATNSAYTMNKVIFDNIGSLSLTSETDVSKQMLDIYNFQIVTSK